VEVAQHRKGRRGTGPATVIGPEWQHKHLERATKAPEKGRFVDVIICATQKGSRRYFCRFERCAVRVCAQYAAHNGLGRISQSELISQSALNTAQCNSKSRTDN
jgi:hypothetical protein